jgi:hypothetical protein
MLGSLPMSGAGKTPEEIIVDVYVILAVLAVALVVLIGREPVCWYLKINDNIRLLREIRDELRRANRTDGRVPLETNERHEP